MIPELFCYLKSISIGSSSDWANVGSAISVVSVRIISSAVILFMSVLLLTFDLRF